MYHVKLLHVADSGYLMLFDVFLDHTQVINQGRNGWKQAVLPRFFRHSSAKTAWDKRHSPEPKKHRLVARPSILVKPGHVLVTSGIDEQFRRWLFNASPFSAQSYAFYPSPFSF